MSAWMRAWVTEMIFLKLMLVIGGGGILLTLVGVVRDIRESFELARLTSARRRQSEDGRDTGRVK